MSDRHAPRSEAAGTPPVHQVAIIGGGFGGIGMAIRLRQAGVDDFVLVEQASAIGGTWRDNHYPGCACDIPANLYSLSFAPRAAWSRRYPTQPEILDYLNDCVARFGLQPHLRLGAAMEEAVFDTARGLWCLRLANGARIEARMLVLSVGLLQRPAIPAIEGLDRFAGACFHSARWDHGVELAGKRVAVIGTGASAIQFVPRIAEQAAQLDLYQRTPPWILPKHDPPAGRLRRQALRVVPLLRRTLRAVTYWQHEVRAVGFVLAPRLMEAVERRARSYAKRQLADGDVRAAMTPAYRIGCKRILLSNDFLPALNRSNVTLLTRPITRVTPHGVCTEDGVERPADILILATGFRASDPLGDLRIVGRDGADLAQAWRDRVPTRLGLAVNGFPNLFLLGGPNTGLGHNSVVFMLEAQIDHVLDCLRRMWSRRAAEIEVTAQAVRSAEADLQRRMARTVWMSGCRSWYLDATGHNTALWPGFSIGYWLRTRFTARSVYRLRDEPAQASAVPPEP